MSLSQPQAKADREARRRRNKWVSWLAFVLIVAFTVVLFFIPREWRVACAIIAAACLFAKEVWSTLARAEDFDSDEQSAIEDRVALFSLSATVFGAPAVIAAIAAS